MKNLMVMGLVLSVACSKKPEPRDHGGSGGTAVDPATPVDGNALPDAPQVVREVGFAEVVAAEVAAQSCSGNIQCQQAPRLPKCGSATASICVSGECRFALDTTRPECACMIGSVSGTPDPDTRPCGTDVCIAGQQTCLDNGTGTKWSVPCTKPASCTPPDAQPVPDAAPLPDAQQPITMAAYCRDVDGDSYCTHDCQALPAPGQPGAPTQGWQLNCQQNEPDVCDQNADKHPGAPERCDGGDWDCDGHPDDAQQCACPVSGQRRCAPYVACFDLNTDIQHCGTCDTDCNVTKPPIPNIMSELRCDSGSCIRIIHNIR